MAFQSLGFDPVLTKINEDFDLPKWDQNLCLRWPLTKYGVMQPQNRPKRHAGSGPVVLSAWLESILAYLSAVNAEHSIE